MNRPVVAFIAHIAPSPNEKQRAWYGVYFEATRWQHCNMASIINTGYIGCQGQVTLATIERILDKVPHGFSLIIETDDSIAAKQLNIALLTRKMGQDVRSESERNEYIYGDRLWPEEMLAPVVNAIDVRTARGQAFVDIIDSSHDTSAAKGLAAARELAQHRMEKDRQNGTASR